jgi:hypothetical protein
MNLFKFGNYIFPENLIAENCYVNAPNQRQDLDPYTDSYGVTQRNALSHTKSAVEITTTPMSWEEMQGIMSGLTSNYINALERDGNCEYFDTENFVVKSGHMYLDPSVKFTVKRKNERFDSMTFIFTEY